ncbi:ATP-dependent DNA ligase [Candidatus Protochlamydia phocaeensis]|uniref:ATP-dependent DNA ligase n=1 Tax=Candidatus Protochlamydia phocaeensis TaxID=1414722 RepID=UPI0008388A5C|nr:ATP-dependent DNA ligase [Candidatus Protochlamydia phocaeensis]
MNDFVELFLRLDQTNKTLDKLQALEDFLRQAAPLDRIWMIALFTGRQPKRTVSSRYLKEWVLESTHLPEWLFEETYHVIGDLAETIALLLPPPAQAIPSSLSQWMQRIESLAQQTLLEKKASILELWNQSHAKERLVFNKILVGGFRLGVSQNLLVRALSQVTGIESNVIAHRLMGEWKPTDINPDFLTVQSEEQAHLTRPYPFCLAYPLDKELEKLGPASDWSAEWKWDGIRGQLVHRQNFLTIWSRGEEIVNDRFPELMNLKDFLPDGCVLDGEILAIQNGSLLPFQILQQRIGRKKITPAILKQIPVIFLAYDLLEWKGEDWRAYPFQRRRQQLEQLFQQLPAQPFLGLSPLLAHQSWDEIREKRQESRAHMAEGIMLKKRDSPYHVGRKKGDWWKWKIESFTVDGVLLYAQKGHGWRANVYSDYTFAVWDQDQLIPFAKAYSGLTKKELAEVDRFIKTHTLEKFGPVRSVKPALVFEIAFEAIQPSKRHKSGVAVRFPRIQRWRRDKKPEDADTLETLKALLSIPK